MFKIRSTLLLVGVLALASVHAFLPPAPRASTTMKVGQSSNTQRGKSVGIINSMRENVESQANPTQVRTPHPSARGTAPEPIHTPTHPTDHGLQLALRHLHGGA